MLRDAVGHTCEVKTAQETGESGEISRNHWEIGGKFGGIQGKIGDFQGNSGKVNFGKNWGGGKFWGNRKKIGELCFPNGETECTDCEINFPHIREKGEKWGKIVSQIFPSGKFMWNRWGKWKGNEREFCFHNQFQLHCTVCTGDELTKYLTARHAHQGWF